MASYVDTVAESLIQQLKMGTAPWQKPWAAGERYVPYNPSSDKPYRGMNVLWLLAQGQEKGFTDKRWLTYNQAMKEGAQVRRGEKGTVVQYWKWQDAVPQKDAEGRPILDQEDKPRMTIVKLERPKVFCAVVFNAEQIEGLAPLAAPDTSVTWATHAKAEAILKASGAEILHTPGDRAFYNLIQDRITLPNRELFPTADGYFATALHELGHWTGHSSRLNRDLAHPFGSEGYAKEELRAEIASLMLGDELAIGHDPGQHAAYVKSWIKVLENDPKEIFRAAAAAEKIKDFVLALERERTLGAETFPEVLMSGADVVIPPASNVPMDQPSAGILMNSPAPSSMQVPMLSTGIQFLSVPYLEKDEARRAGARWDKAAKSWYAPAGVPLEPLAKWLPERIESQIPAIAVTPREEFANALRGAGFIIDGLPQMDGNMQRARVEGDRESQKSGSYVGFLDGHPAGYINNFKSGVEITWKSQAPIAALSEGLKTMLNQEARMRLDRRAEERRLTQAAAAARSAHLLATGPIAPGDHEYLKRKGLEGNPHQLKLDTFGNLLIAACDIEGNVRSLQRIAPDGKKLFTKGGRMEGSHALLVPEGQTAAHAQTLVIAEGYATAATISRSINLPVAVAFSAGNLLSVAESYRQKYPDIELLIAGDNDHQKPLQIGVDGQPKKNVGKEKSMLAAAAVGGYALLPPFKAGEEGTDWNDFEMIRGREMTRQTLLDGLEASRVQRVSQSIQRTPGIEFTALTPAQRAQAEATYSTASALDDYLYTVDPQGRVIARVKDDAPERENRSDEQRLADARLIDEDRRQVNDARRTHHDGERVAETLRLHQGNAFAQERSAEIRSALDTVRNGAETEAVAQELQPKRRRGR